MRKYIYIQGFGFVRNERKSEFRKRKMHSAELNCFYGANRTPSQETDLN